MKKALFVATITGHINTFHLPYLQLLKEKGYKVYVATGDNKKVEKYCDKKYNISLKRTPYDLKNIMAIKQLKKIIDEEKFDLIHCHTPMGAVITRLAAKKTRKKHNTKVIYTAHGFHFYKGAPLKNWIVYYPVELYLSKFTDTIITINKEDYELAKKHFSKRCKDIQYVPGVGIDIKKFDIKLSEAEQKVLKKSLCLKESSLILTNVARLDKNKNQGFLIDSMEKINKIDSNIHLLLVGPDELNGYYQMKVKKCNLEKNIHFLGKRDDIPEILKITDIVVSASQREGLPVNVMESLASNVPVIALNCRGMKDLISNGKNGYIVSNQEEFIDKVLQLKNEKLKNIKINISFSIDSIREKMAKIYFK